VDSLQRTHSFDNYADFCPKYRKSLAIAKRKAYKGLIFFILISP